MAERDDLSSRRGDGTLESVRKDIRDLVKRAADQGWRVDERRSGTIML
jgi:hypothetical protein